MATFSNSATLSYNGNITTSNIVTGTLQEVLTVSKTAVMNDYTANDDVTFVITIVNSGNVAFTGVTVTDNLGNYAFGAGSLYPLTYTDDSIHYYINGVLQTTAPTVDAGPPLVISGISIPANGNIILIYEASANQFAPLAAASTITNTVTVTGGGISTTLTASEVIGTQDVAILTISKAICPSTVTENGQVTYTFTIQNSGNTAALAGANIVITDVFNPVLDPISVVFGDTPWVRDTNYTYNEESGVFSTVQGQVTVPAATYTQNPTTGAWTVVPGVSTLVVTGTV